MPDRIILKGYYGFGNLGDDILMHTCYRWMREHYPSAEILISTESKNPFYVRFLLGENVRIIHSSENVKADWIIYGGGGVFFDFSVGNWSYWMLNQFIRILGHENFQKLYRAYRSLRGTSGIKSRFRAGLGIGVGTYTPSSRKFYAQLNDLLDFDFMMVRDEVSLKHLQNLKLKFTVSIGSDLAFMVEYWKDSGWTLLPENRNNKIIGIILRDWVYDHHEAIHALLKSADQLAGKGYSVRCFSFDGSADPVFISCFSDKYPMQVWDPQKNFSFAPFMQSLSQCSFIITSRAHGAILSAGLGIPSVCLNQEPKLEQVSRMLHHSSVLINKPFIAEDITKTIEKKMIRLNDLKECVKRDVAENRTKLLRGLEAFQEFAEKY
jgi:polysaccharide pyruvyl transferase WcaK-like protein